MRIFLIFLFIINSAFAQNAVKLNKGDITPFKGVLLTEAKVIELDKAQRSNIVLRDLRMTQDELIAYHKGVAKDTRQKLSDAKFEAHMTNIGYFVLGVLLTGFAFKTTQTIGDI